MKLHVIGYASDIAANHRGAAGGPIVIKNANALKQLPIQWEGILETPSTERGLAATDAVKTLCEKLALHTAQFTKEKQPFLSIGGDHSSAIGTWSGAANALDGPLGLIWIDAHMDAHTPDTSITKNIYGMPLATLLGYGDPRLTEIVTNIAALKPDNLVLIGIRDFEKAEVELLKKLNVKIYFMKDVKKRGLSIIFKEALEIVTKNTTAFGVSIDLDALDPEDAPGVSIQSKNGIRVKELLDHLSLIIKHPNFIGTEIAEFCPNRDKNHKTEQLIIEIIQKLF